MEFADVDSVQNALALHESVFKGRQLKVSAKRTNVPGFGGRGGGMPPMMRAVAGFRRPRIIPRRRFTPYQPY